MLREGLDKVQSMPLLSILARRTKPSPPKSLMSYVPYQGGLCPKPHSVPSSAKLGY